MKYNIYLNVVSKGRVLVLIYNEKTSNKGLQVFWNIGRNSLLEVSEILIQK